MLKCAGPNHENKILFPRVPKNSHQSSHSFGAENWSYLKLKLFEVKSDLEYDILLFHIAETMTIRQLVALNIVNQL